MLGAAGNGTTELFVESDNARLSIDQPETLNSIAWSDLGDSFKRRSLTVANKEMREKLLLFLRKCINPLDGDCAQLVRIPAVLRARSQDQEPNLTHAVDIRDALLRRGLDLGLGARRRKSARCASRPCQSVPDWLVIYQIDSRS